MFTSLVVITELKSPLVAGGSTMWSLHVLPISAWVLSRYSKVRLPAETKASAAI